MDLDGTFFLYGSNELAPGSASFAEDIKRRGDKLYFVTARKKDNIPFSLNIEETKMSLRKHGIHYEKIIYNCSSPRLIINDEGCNSVNVKTDEGLLDIHEKITPTIQRIHHSLLALIWVNAKYGDDGDADDFVQTIAVAESLLENNGFNHEHLVSTFRSPPKVKMNNKILEKAGVKISYKGQIAKLLSSSDPLYVAVDGVSDGAAMRTLGIGAFFRKSTSSLISNAATIASITHGSHEAILSSVLTSLRFSQLFLGDLNATPLQFFDDFKESILSIMSLKDARYFLDQTYKAARLADKIKDPNKLLRALAKHIGITHLAWGTPIAATFWSFHQTTDFIQYFKGYTYREILSENNKYLDKAQDYSSAININSFSKVQKLREIRHLKKIGELDDFRRCHGHHYGFIDIDTFFSISISMLAARNGISGIYAELATFNKVFNVDSLSLASYLYSAGEQSPFEFNAENIYY